MPTINETTGYLDDLGKRFDGSVVDLHKAMTEALEKLDGKASDPVLLAEFQRKSGDYAVMRSAQSNVVKLMKDVDMGIVSNFR